MYGIIYVCYREKKIECLIFKGILIVISLYVLMDLNNLLLWWNFRGIYKGLDYLFKMS